MKIIRRTDYYGQLIFGCLTLLFAPILLFYGFLEVILIPVCWQLLSAGFNTRAFVHTGRSKQIGNYWSFCAAGLLFLFISWYFGKTFNADNIRVFYWIALSASVFIAIYYLKIYRDLIQLFSLRDELDGLTKSKH